MQFEWKDQYTLGIDEIDEQHKKLLSIGLRAEEMLELGDTIDYYDDIMEILAELVEYTEYHFDSEEKIFNGTAYPKITEHEIEHKFFVRKLQKTLEKDIDEDQIGHLKEIVDFVGKWVLHHILKTDKEYVQYLK